MSNIENKVTSPVELFNQFLEICDVATKSDLLNRKDEKGLEQYRVLRTQIEDILRDYDNVVKENAQLKQKVETQNTAMDSMHFEIAERKTALEKSNKMFIDIFTPLQRHGISISTVLEAINKGKLIAKDARIYENALFPNSLDFSYVFSIRDFDLLKGGE